MSGYNLWFNRFYRIQIAYQNGFIARQDLIKYQIFLLDSGQFNANFVLEELKKLNYPLSPFARMDKHTYVRSADTWAAEMLRSEYRKQLGITKVVPLWLDSPAFWTELNRYCQVLKEADIAARIPNIIDDFIFNNGQLKNPLWVELEIPHERQTIINHKKEIERLIEQHIFNAVVRHNEFQSNVIALFKVVFEQRTQQLKENFDSKPDVLAALDNLFPDIKRTEQQKIIKQRNELDNPKNLADCDEAWFKKVVGLGRKYKVALPHGLEKEKNIKSWAQQNEAVFLNFLSDVQANIKLEFISVSQYTQSIQQWLSNNVASYAQLLAKQIAYYYADNYKGIDSVVFCDCNKLHEFITSVIGNIGYQIDPLRLARIFLKNYPLLFVDKEQTKHFWEIFMQIPMVTALPEEEQKALQQIGKKIISLTETNLKDKKLLPCPWAQELSSLKKWLAKLQGGFKLYGQFLYNYLMNYQAQYKEHEAVRLILDREIKQALIEFLKACETADLSMAVRNVQAVVEAMLLDFEHKPLLKQLPEIVTAKLSNYPVQTILMTPYAMRAFIRIFQVLDPQNSKDKTLKVSVTNQSYFEWLQNLERLHSRGFSVFPVQHLREIDLDSDVIFVEIHPNNVVETKQFAHDVRGLIECLKSCSPQMKRTLVIDATLNDLGDREIQQLLTDAVPLIDSGYLNIMLIQSLTKFSQAGVDKRSAGMVLAINNGRDWKEVNAELDKLKRSEKVDASTVNLFSYFASHRDLINEYIRLINRNVRYVYEKIIKQLAALEVPNRHRFQLTMSSDPRACYIGLNMGGLLPDVDRGFALKLADVETFAEDVMLRLIHPLCEIFALPITERMSIGFPLVSANLVFDSMRFTIGLESDKQLDQYADILAYVSFVLNRMRDPEWLFDKDDAKHYALRNNYFKEKHEQFKAMLPGLNHRFIMEFEGAGSGNSYTEQGATNSRQLKRQVIIENGNWEIIREMPHPREYRTINQIYRSTSIYFPKRGVGRIQLSDPRVSLPEKRMAVACLTQYTRPGKENHHNVNLSFDNLHHTVDLASMEIIGSWNGKDLFGPFSVGGQRIYFQLYQKRIFAFVNNQWLEENTIFVKQGNVITPLTDMPIEDRELLFRDGYYELDRSIPAIRQTPQKFEYSMQFLPKQRDAVNFAIRNGQLIIEMDHVCCRIQGATVYKRLLETDRTCYEIDFWKVKDPTLARFMRLMTAIYIKENYDKNFIARNNRFTHFLFAMNFEQGDVIFAKAVTVILSNQDKLSTLLDDYQRQTNAQYTCRGQVSLSWPSRLSGVDYIWDKDLIDQAIDVLNAEPIYALEADSENAEDKTRTAQQQEVTAKGQTKNTFVLPKDSPIRAPASSKQVPTAPPHTPTVSNNDQPVSQIQMRLH